MPRDTQSVHANMSQPFKTSIQALDRLQGVWTGEGRGYFPGVTSLDIRATLSFTRHDEKTLAYEQRAQKLYDGQTEWLESHWESGFLRVLENNELELTSAQIGRTEVLLGIAEVIGSSYRLSFTSKIIMNDSRMLSSARMWTLEDGMLRYEMEMHTTKVEQSTPHLTIDFRRVD